MSTAVPVPQLEPTQDERTMAVLAHALQVVGWFIAPLIIFLMKRESRFVAFHALQALLLQALILMFWIVIMVVFFAVIFATIGMNPQPQQAPQAPPVAVMVMFPLFWLGGMGGWVLVLVCAIVYAIKAGRGEWAAYPVLGQLARRMLKL